MGRRNIEGQCGKISQCRIHAPSYMDDIKNVHYDLGLNMACRNSFTSKGATGLVM